MRAAPAASRPPEPLETEVLMIDYSSRMKKNPVEKNSVLSFLPQEFLYTLRHDLFAASVFEFQFSCPAVAHTPFLIYQVNRRPPLLCPARPVLDFLIEQDGIGDAQPFHAANDIGRHFLFVRLRGMNANDDNVLLGKPLLPSAVTRQVMLAVDSTKCPELYDGHFAFT